MNITAESLQEESIESKIEIGKHRQLVEVAYKWVLANTSCGIAFKELHTNACNGEHPDVIGFAAWGHSVLVEVKVSRSDFLSDKKKSFRKSPELGMGRQRFYCCPVDLIKKEELPQGWGLIYVTPKLKARCIHSPYKGNIGERHNGFQSNIKAEHGLMYSALRRLHLKNLIDEVYKVSEEGYNTFGAVERGNKERMERELFEQTEDAEYFRW